MFPEFRKHGSSPSPHHGNGGVSRGQLERLNRLTALNGFNYFDYSGIYFEPRLQVQAIGEKNKSNGRAQAEIFTAQDSRVVEV